MGKVHLTFAKKNHIATGVFGLRGYMVPALSAAQSQRR